MLQVERVLVERAVVALMAALAPQRHLALRVVTEHRGGCGWQRCAPSCVVHREVIAELWAVLEGGNDATPEAQAQPSRGEAGESPSAGDPSDPADSRRRLSTSRRHLGEWR